MTHQTPRPASAAERFFTRVDMTGDCWKWTASKHPFGHGQFWDEGQKFFAHRWLYKLFVGPIPEGLELDHLCRVPACVRPSHLEPVTRRENILRGVSPSALNARKTHCPQGHPYDETNTQIGSASGRVCRTCHRDLIRAIAHEKRPRGASQPQPCSVCGVAYLAMPNGALYRHHGITPAGFSTGERCAGSGKPPRVAQ